MNIRELFDVEMAIPFDVEGHTITFYFRNPTTEEELEFRRRTSRQRIKENGTIEASDAALKAPMYLYTRCLKKITIQNGSGHVDEVSEEDQKHIPDQIKLDAWTSARTHIKKKEAADLQD